MKKKFYITTSIAYTNRSPHIGFAFELVQADVLARYHRFLGKEVFFLTGTDEHGAKVAKAAAREKKNPKEFVNKISKSVRALKQILNLSNDDFIRTTDQKRHWPAVRKVWLQLKANGDIYKKKYKGLYCSGCEAFIAKRDLKKNRCAIHQIKPRVIEEENYFFRLSRYSKKIERAISENKIQIIPQTRKNEILKFVKQGLEDVSFSRPRKDLQWGIPVPDDKTHTVYVWCDALVNYISALSFTKNSQKFKKFWPADVHCIGKDILRFHGAIWPGMILSLGLPFPKKIFVHGFITVGGKKMSKSLGNVIDPFELVKKYGTDPVRYFLLREIPPTEDGDFTYEKFEQRYNADLASGLGNLVARVLTLAEKINFKNAVKDSQFQNRIKNIWKSYHKALNEFQFNTALILIWKLIHFCDKYIERQQPWRFLTSNPKSKITYRRQEGGGWIGVQNPKIKEILSNLLFALANIAKMLRPFLPETAEKIFSQLGIDPESKKPWKFRVKKGKPLFPRLNP